MPRKVLRVVLPLLAVALLAGGWFALSDAGRGSLPFLAGADEPGPRPRPQPVGPADESTACAGAGSSTAPAGGGTKAATGESTSPAPEAGREATVEGSTGGSGPTATTPDPEPAGTAPATGPKATTPEPANPQPRPKRPRKVIQGLRHPPNQSLGNHRPAARRLKEEIGKVPLADVGAQLRQDRRGLFAKDYAFDRPPLEVLTDPNQPDLDQRPPTVTRIDQQVHFPSKDAWSDLNFDLGNFMAVWEGFLVIDQPGDYWLFLGTDLNGRVVLSGETVLLNDAMDYVEVSTVLTLSEGLHPLRIEYLEARNGSVVEALGACNFMYVPTGDAQPVPVPPDMLLLPKHLWSDNAPIITHLSKTSGEIGDEITIHGKNFVSLEFDNGTGSAGTTPRVQIAGQEAAIVAHSDTALSIRIPVGAATGKVVVFGPMLKQMNSADPVQWIPSNSLDFKVTTQFGLFASWHNLQGWSNFDFIEPGMHEPDLVRLEREFQFSARDKLDLAFRDQPLACHWEGKLGVPHDWVAAEQQVLVRFAAYGRLRVTLDGQTRETAAVPGGSNDLTTLDFEVTAGSERYLPLAIDLTNESGPAALQVVRMERPPVDASSPEEQQSTWVQTATLPAHLFFPPVVPPRPPEIRNVRPLWPEGEQPPALPYAPSTLVSIREGQAFEFEVVDYGPASLWAEDAPNFRLFADGVPVVFEVLAKAQSAEARSQQCRAVLPAGLGEGLLVARLSVVQSAPYAIDVTNKGLIAYLYDLPAPGGYDRMPELEPLACFGIRKDKQVNFENANSFRLPFPAETFAIEWYGALIVEQEGDYVFTGRTDDGVILWLDDKLVLEDDNLHYQREKSSEPVHLSAGRHTFRMRFFENNVHEVCVLQWEARQGETEILHREVIPARAFTWDEHPPLPDKQATGKRADGSNPEG
ncbi:MAG: IPT/TIG domain-containing protein [Planctomycetes bacterium]|nr:IPT/TIG domain-containing protein [Planctomycetota bacterium]